MNGGRNSFESSAVCTNGAMESLQQAVVDEKFIS